jgi:hypothetical protein
MMRPIAAVLAAITLAAGLSACGESERPLASPDLQCAGARSGTFEPDDVAPAFADPDEAAVDMLQPSQRRYGGAIVQVRPGVQALVVDDRRVLVAQSGRPFDGIGDGYVFGSLHWCEGFFEG